MSGVPASTSTFYRSPDSSPWSASDGASGFDETAAGRVARRFPLALKHQIVGLTILLAMLLGVFGTAAAQARPAVQIRIVADPIRKVEKQGYFVVELKTKGNRRVKVGISYFDDTISTSVTVLAPRSVLIARTKKLSVDVNMSDLSTQLEYAGPTMTLTATIRQGHRLLSRTKLTLRRQPVADTFIPAAGTHYSGLTSQGKPISFDIGPKSTEIDNFMVEVVHPNGFDSCPPPPGGPGRLSFLYPDGVFAVSGAGDAGFNFWQGYFSQDGQAHGFLGHTDRSDSCSYQLNFTAAPTPGT